MGRCAVKDSCEKAGRAALVGVPKGAHQVVLIQIRQDVLLLPLEFIIVEDARTAETFRPLAEAGGAAMRMVVVAGAAAGSNSAAEHGKGVKTIGVIP